MPKTAAIIPAPMPTCAPPTAALEGLAAAADPEGPVTDEVEEGAGPPPDLGPVPVGVATGVLGPSPALMVPIAVPVTVPEPRAVLPKAPEGP